MSIGPRDVPKFLVLEPQGGIRLDVRLPTPAVEIDVALENPRPGRSFILLVGRPAGQFVQRARIAGRARILFDPGAPGLYVVLLTNPMSEAAVVRMRLKPIETSTTAGAAGPGARATARGPLKPRRSRRSNTVRE